MNFQEVIEKYPTLSSAGFKPGGPIHFSANITSTILWLKENFKPNKRAGHGIWAYSFKHRMREENDVYVTNGEFIAAAIMGGFPVSKDEIVAVSSKSMLSYDLKRVGHLPFARRNSGNRHLLKWDIKQHYKWHKMPEDKSIPDNYVQLMKDKYPTLTRDGFSVRSAEYDLDLPSIRKAAGWLKTMGFSSEGELVSPGRVGVMMGWCTNFYPGVGNTVAAMEHLKLEHTPDFEISFDKRSVKRIELAHSRIKF